jgi:hypothetical protein
MRAGGESFGPGCRIARTLLVAMTASRDCQKASKPRDFYRSENLDSLALRPRHS